MSKIKKFSTKYAISLKLKIRFFNLVTVALIKLMFRDFMILFANVFEHLVGPDQT